MRARSNRTARVAAVSLDCFLRVSPHPYLARKCINARLLRTYLRHLASSLSEYFLPRRPPCPVSLLSVRVSGLSLPRRALWLAGIPHQKRGAVVGIGGPPIPNTCVRESRVACLAGKKKEKRKDERASLRVKIIAANYRIPTHGGCLKVATARGTKTACVTQT